VVGKQQSKLTQGGLGVITITRKSRTLFVLLILAFGLAVVGSVAAFSSLIRTTTPLEWPAFVMTYEIEGEQYLMGESPFRQLEIRTLDWKAKNDWHVEVIESESFLTPGGNPFSTVGYTRQQSGQRIIEYHPMSGEHSEYRLDDPDGYQIPDGPVFPHYRTLFGIDETRDGERITLAVDVCYNDHCQGEVAAIRYETPSGIDLIVSDDEWGIPLQFGSFNVREIKVQASR
jgi:hypothetical protein